MGIYFDVGIAGETIGRKLADDPEETAYALRSLLEEAPKAFGEEIAEYLSWDEKAAVAGFLRRFADQVHASETTTTTAI